MLEARLRQGDLNHITGDIHYLAYALDGNKTILTIHDIGRFHYLKGIRRLLYFYLWVLLPIKKVALVTTISNTIKKEILAHVNVPPDKIKVVYNPIRSEYKPFSKEFNMCKPVILQIGTGGNKNLNRVVKAIKDISCHFRIIGKLTDDQKTLLESCKIDYTNAYDLSDNEMVDEYRRSDILIFASTYEGFGLPIIEAQAVGRPVITSNIEPMTEIAGLGAHFINPYDIIDIKRGIMKVIEEKDYRERLIINGFENIKRFESKNIANEYLKIYQNLFNIINKKI